MGDKSTDKISVAGAVVHSVGILLAAALTELFLVLSLQYFRGEWQTVFYMLALIGGSIFNAALAAIDLICFFFRKHLVSKLCITVYVFLVFTVVLLYVLLRTGFLEIMQDEVSFEAYLEKSGKWMAVLFVTLQFLQVVVLPIPSTVTVVAGSALFGPLWGSLYSLLGILLGSLCAFLIGRYAGYRAVAWLVGKETLDKWLKKVKGKDKLLLSAMFLLPVFPDDLLCFVAGISSMSLWFFIAVILISRILGIFTTSYSVSLIPFNTWWGILIWVILFSLVAVLFVVLYRKSDDILAWFERKFHRETRVKTETARDEFTLKVVDPDGSIVEKGVKREGTENEQKPKK